MLEFILYDKELDIDLDEWLNIFKSYKQDPCCGTGVFKVGLYKREYIALTEYMMSRV